jgi:hypothetical protein
MKADPLLHVCLCHDQQCCLLLNACSLQLLPAPLSAKMLLRDGFSNAPILTNT